MTKSVIVHLGSARAPWVFRNLKRHLSLFPEVPLIFISDNVAHLKKAEKMGSETFLYEPTKIIENLFDKSAHEKYFRQNFWRTSIERFFAIQQMQMRFEEEPYLHIESDVVLMPNFPWEKLGGLAKLTWLNQNEIHDCAALVFLPTRAETNWLINELVAGISKDVKATDMKLLHEIRQANPERISLFPSVSSDIASQDLLSDQARFSEITELADYFGGIFDSVHLGMWLTGQNPRNLGGKVIRYEKDFIEDCDFNSNSFSIFQDKLYVGRIEPLPVFNLHVHSKNLNLFSWSGEKKLNRIVKQSSTLSRKRSFSWRGWLGSKYDVFISVKKRPLVFLTVILRIDTFLLKIKKSIGKVEN